MYAGCLATRCCVYTTYVVKRPAVLKNALTLRVKTHIYTVPNKMAILGYVYTLAEQTLRSPERCTSRNATSAEFLEVQISPHVLVYEWDP